ncbi:MAG TPA: chorismate lyase [Burkholderiales bacterium]|nr:chorismate lyase [Burkholderiales bacterium]
MNYLQCTWQPSPVNAQRSYRGWLTDHGSLTHRLQARCPSFSVRAVHQRLGNPCRDEMPLIKSRRKQRVVVREVYLYCRETPVVFAHSVLKQRNLRGAWRTISRQGVKPLGAALFANPLVKRMPLHFKKLTPHHELYLRACRLLKTLPNHLWARRSVFILRGSPIMVTEVFLPTILELSQ